MIITPSRLARIRAKGGKSLESIDKFLESIDKFLESGFFVAVDPETDAIWICPECDTQIYQAAKLRRKKKPKRCPTCNSAKIASILFGKPLFSKELVRQIDAGEVVLGGCMEEGHEPAWRCVDCNTQIYHDRL